MTDQAKRLPHLFTPNGKSMAHYEALETENAKLKAQVETLQRQVDILIRRNAALDPDLQLPTKH